MIDDSEKHRIEQYDANRWAEQTDLGKRVYVWGFFMGGNELNGWSLVKALPYDFNERKSCIYMWQKVESDVEELIRIDVFETVSWKKSQETLLEQLGELQAPNLPEAASRKIDIGDVAYIGFGQIVQSVMFTRANMVVHIRSVGKKEISVVETAKQIDELFISKPQLSKKGVIPEIEVFSSRRKTIGVDEILPLDIEAKDPLDRPLWYKLIGEQGEFFVKDKKVHFISKTSGLKEISLFGINENGFVAGSTLSIHVK